MLLLPGLRQTSASLSMPRARRGGLGRLSPRGVGQAASPPVTTPPTPASAGTTTAQQQAMQTQLAAAEIVPTSVAGLGGLATVVGLIGALVSDDHKEAFLITAATGFVASVVGAGWAASNLANFMAANPSFNVNSLSNPAPAAGV
jgi:hypothetical protein